jgi:hypothetical protein
MPSNDAPPHSRRYPAPVVIGAHIGRWTVTGPVRRRRTRTSTVLTSLCQCVCGTKRWVLHRSLREGRSRSCGCAQRRSPAVTIRAKQLIGQWTVTSKNRRLTSGRARGTVLSWWCRCACGTERWVLDRSLRDGKSRNCGCMRFQYLAQTRRREQVALAARGKKRCSTCHRIKPLRAFCHSRRQFWGRHYSCRVCTSRAGRASYRRRHPVPTGAHMQKRATLYVWLDPETAAPVYVGKTTLTLEMRFRQQQRLAQSSHEPASRALRWLRRQLRQGLLPVARPIAIYAGKNAGWAERYCARQLHRRGFLLLNDPTALGAGNPHILPAQRRHALEPYLGVIPDRMLAEAHDVSWQTIQHDRLALGRLLKKPGPIIQWTPALNARLGTKPDADVARELGCTFQLVALHRKRLGVPSFRSQPEHQEQLRKRPPRFVWSADVEARLGIEPDRVIAEALGCSPALVCVRRKRLGIPPFRSWRRSRSP